MRGNSNGESLPDVSMSMWTELLTHPTQCIMVHFRAESLQALVLTLQTVQNELQLNRDS